MVEDIDIVIRTDGRINRYIYRSELQCAQVDKIPFGPVVADHPDFIACFHTQFH